MADFGLYLRDVSKKPSPSGEWLRNGHSISKDDLKYARNGVERISASEAMEMGGGRGPSAEYRGWTPKFEGANGGKEATIKKGQTVGAAKTEGSAITFGKYKGKPMKWVRDNDPSYWEWCAENINWFAAAVKKAGL